MHKEYKKTCMNMMNKVWGFLLTDEDGNMKVVKKKGGQVVGKQDFFFSGI